MLKCAFKGLQKNNKSVRAVKFKPKALLHLKVHPALTINETFHKQAESMCLDFNFYPRIPRRDCKSGINKENRIYIREEFTRKKV